MADTHASGSAGRWPAPQQYRDKPKRVAAAAGLAGAEVRDAL